MHVNWLAVVIAFVVNFGIGMVWYSPALFGKRFQALLGKSVEQLKQEGFKPARAMVLYFMAGVIAAYTLALVGNYANARTVVDGAKIGVMVWLGFVATSVLPGYLFEGRPKGLYVLFVSYQLVSYLLMGVIIAVLH